MGDELNARKVGGEYYISISNGGIGSVTQNIWNVFKNTYLGGYSVGFNLPSLGGLPYWLRNAVFARNKNGGKLLSRSDDPNFLDQDALKEVDIDDAQVVTAKIKGTNSYRLMLDLDGEHYYRKSSSGNGHLIVNVQMSREEHDLIMEMLSSVNVIEHGFAKASQTRKQGACLRAPWVVKGEDKSRNEQSNSP